MAKKDEELEDFDAKCKCGCGEDIDPECNCDGECNCGEDCHCGEGEKCCESDFIENNDESECCEVNYLKDLQRLQAEFDNYRKRMQTALGEARKDGFMEAVEKFIPALDSFKMATEYIQDKNTLMGIQFIEKGILDTLNKMGVEVIDASGKFDPNFHLAIATEDAENFESGDIVKECYKGFIYQGKVIRYSQVVVKK